MKTILIADRDPATRATLAAIILEKGLGVVMASDGERARAVLEDNPSIAGVVAEATLPTAHEASLVTVLRQNPLYQELPIIAVGTAATVDSALQALERGASRYIVASVMVRALPEELDAVLLA